MASVVLKACGVWLLFMLLAIANGIIREKLLLKTIGERPSLPVSGISLALVIFLTTLLMVPYLGIASTYECRAVGFMWLTMTVAFEFVFGRYVMGSSWKKLLQAYNVFHGNLWVVVLITITLAPCLSARLRGLIP